MPAGHPFLRKELKEQFLRELTPYEQILFLKKANEAINSKGYPAGENLFYYCYFNTLKERMLGINTQGGDGILRLLFVEGSKEIEETIIMYEERLEEKKLSGPDIMGYKFLEYFSEHDL